MLYFYMIFTEIVVNILGHAVGMKRLEYRRIFLSLLILYIRFTSEVPHYLQNLLRCEQAATKFCGGVVGFST